MQRNRNRERYLTTINETDNFQDSISSDPNLLSFAFDKSSSENVTTDTQIPNTSSSIEVYKFNPKLTSLRKMLPQTSAKLIKLGPKKALKKDKQGSSLITQKISMNQRKIGKAMFRSLSENYQKEEEKICEKISENQHQKVESFMKEIQLKCPQVDILYDCYDKEKVENDYKYIFNIETNQEVTSIDEITEENHMVILSNRKNIIFDTRITGFDPETNTIVNMLNIHPDEAYKFQALSISSNPSHNSLNISNNSPKMKTLCSFYEYLPIKNKKNSEYVIQPTVLQRKNYFSPQRYYHGRYTSHKRFCETIPIRFPVSEIAKPKKNARSVPDAAGFRLTRFKSTLKLKDNSLTQISKQKIHLKELKPVLNYLNYNKNNLNQRNDMVEICIKYNLTSEEFSTMIHDFVGLEIIGETAGIVSKREVGIYYKISQK